MNSTARAAARSARSTASRLSSPSTSAAARLRFASSASALGSSSASVSRVRLEAATASSSSTLLRRTLATAVETTSHNPSASFVPYSTASSSSPPPPQPVAGAEAVQSVLADTGKLLANDVGGSTDWYDRVHAASTDLTAARRGRLAVIGDSLAAPHDVVSAFLQDPLADTAAMRNSLLERYYGTGSDTLVISYGQKSSRTPGHLACPSGWLQQSKCDVVEVNTSEGARRADMISSLVASDTVMVVLDPIRLARAPVIGELLPLVLAKGNVHFVVNGRLPPHVTEAQLRATLESQIKECVSPGLHGPVADCSISFVQADTALRALFALDVALEGHQTGSKGAAFDAFQRDFLVSNMGPLQTQLLTALPAEYQVKTAACTAHLALAYTEGVIAGDRHVLQQAASVVDQLHDEAKDGASRAQGVSVVARGIEGGVVEGSVEQSVDASKTDIQTMFAHRLSWLSLVLRLRVDDVGAELGAYLNRSFARDIEKQLVFEAGELAQLQTSLGDSSDKTARQLTAPETKTAAAATTPSTSVTAGHPFSSPLLLNHLHALSLTIPRVSPDTLLAPVTTRRAQLLSVSVPRLQVAAQRALLSTYALTATGAAAAWAASVPPLSLISGYTAVGLGALAAVSSLALGQALWARAQRRWWADWGRVTDMLKDDLAETYDRAVHSLVLAQPSAAAEGLRYLASKRGERLSELGREVHVLRDRLEATGLGPREE